MARHHLVSCFLKGPLRSTKTNPPRSPHRTLRCFQAPRAPAPSRRPSERRRSMGGTCTVARARVAWGRGGRKGTSEGKSFVFLNLFVWFWWACLVLCCLVCFGLVWVRLGWLSCCGLRWFGLVLFEDDGFCLGFVVLVRWGFVCFTVVASGIMWYIWGWHVVQFLTDFSEPLWMNFLVQIWNSCSSASTDSNQVFYKSVLW